MPLTDEYGDPTGKGAAAVVGLVVAVVVLVVGGIVALAGGSMTRTSANDWGCNYGGGAFDSKGLKSTVKPGSSGGFHVFDRFNKVPADDRYYIIDSDPGTADAGGQPILVPTKPLADTAVGPEVSVEIQARFKFNENACEWYTRHGKRQEPLNYNVPPGEPSGWASFLNTNFRQAIVESARDVVRGYTYVDLYSNAEVDGVRVYDKLEETVAKELTASLKRNLGGEFFCGPSYVFDGDFDSEVTCPSIEVVVPRVVPTNTKLITNQEAIQAAKDQEKVIAAEQAQALAEQNRQQAVGVAEQKRRSAVEVEQAKAQEAINTAQAKAQAALVPASKAKAEADAAFCLKLAEVGIRCDLYKAAENGNFPQVVSDESVIQVPARP